MTPQAPSQDILQRNNSLVRRNRSRLVPLWHQYRRTNPANRLFRSRIAGIGRESLPARRAPAINDL